MDADDKYDFVKNRTVRGHETEYRSATGNMTALAKARELIADQFEVAWGMYPWGTGMLCEVPSVLGSIQRKG